MGKVYAFANHKGGVGKTTSVLNLGAALAAAGKRVLLIDGDPQGNLTLGLHYEPDSIEKTLLDVFANNNTGLSDVLQHPRENLDLVPANLLLRRAPLHIGGKPGAEHLLRLKVRQVREQYDYIFIDCRPDLDLLTSNALVAADYVIIPVDCQFFSLKGMVDLMEFISDVQKLPNPDLKIFGILPNKYDGTSHAAAAVEVMKQGYGDLLLPILIKRRVAVADAQAEGKSIIETMPRSDVAESYRQLAKEVITRG